jgi:hypothetical protein
MISIKPEIEDIINNKFMKKIQSNTVVYDVNQPSIYSTVLEPDSELIKTGDDESVSNVYKYLNDETLNKVMNVNTDTEFNYVLYSIVDDCDTPYVKFLMNNDNNIMKFPNEKIILENIDDDSGSDSESDDIIPFTEDDDNESFSISSNNDDYGDETLLPEQCSQYLKNNFGITYENTNDFYRGYVEIEDKIYIFIDTSIIHNDFPDENQFSWVVIDEILYKKSSNNVPICKIVTTMFSNNSIIKNIYNENNEIIGPPICVYICENTEDSIINTENSGRLNDSLVSNTIKHDIFGNITMFSTTPFSSGYNYNRYCLFTSNANYILHTNFTKHEVGYIADKSCVRFPYNNVECWAVKDSRLFSHI